jgi:3-hydroxyacyl-[acyl-carrier-protein] dehydratase
MNKKSQSIDINGILQLQQNRYPMLFIDKVTNCVPGEFAEGYKLFSHNEWYFHGFDTDNPKVWNVIQLEAMSQMFLMTFYSLDLMKGKIAMSNRFDNVNFYRKIIPGDRLDLEASLISFKRGIAKGKVKGLVEGNLACSMECIIVVPELMINFQSVEKSPLENFELPTKKDFIPLVDFGIEKVKSCILNKYPWLFIDKVLDIKPGQFVHSVKNFTYNEHFFPTHFEGDPSVPGFIQIETCMQNFLLTFLSMPGFNREETADRQLGNIVVRKKIRPGDALEVKAYLDSFKRGVAKGRVESFVDSEPAISFDVTAVVLKEFNKYMPGLNPVS